jgi:hypothetical protein
MNEFLVSVADVILRDPTTGNALMHGKANISSAFTLTMASADVRAGINNALLYSYYHTRELTVKVEAATISETILALNVGATVATGAVNVLETDCIVLTSGSGVVTNTPVGDVSVILPNGNITTVTPSTKNIYVSGGADQLITAIYTTSKSADQITVATTTPPSIVDLTLVAEIRASSQSSVTKYMQINIPRFQVTGGYTLSLAANGVSTESLEGKALAATSTDCTSGDYFAKVSFIPVTSSTSYSSIASIPSTITFPAASGSATSQITVLGIKGGLYANTVITTDCTYSVTGSYPGIGVGASTGLVSVSGSLIAAGYYWLVNATYASGSMVDYTRVVVS